MHHLRDFLWSHSGSFQSPVNMIRRWIGLAFHEAFILWHFIDREFVNNNIQRLLESGTVDRDVSYGSQSSQSDADDEKAI